MDQTLSLPNESITALLVRLARYVFRLVVRPKHVAVEKIILRIPAFAQGAVLHSLYADRYERLERILLPSLLQPDDRVVELGSAIGLIGLVCCQKISAQQLVMVEANRDLIPEITYNFHNNGVQLPRLIHGIAAAGKTGDADFHVSRQFWASSDRLPEQAALRVDQVQQIDTNRLLLEHRATALICDIEGGEMDLLPFLDYSNIRLVVAELHPAVIGQKGVVAIVGAMEKAGLSLRQILSNEVYIFQR